MADSTLTREQGVALLKRLSGDDGFRQLFESQPAKALHDLGISAETIVNLSGMCLCPRPLASKEELGRVLDRLEDDVFASALKMVIPSVKLPGK